MQKEHARELAVKLKQSMSELNEAVSIFQRSSLTNREKARLAKSIGQIFAIMSDEIYTFLVAKYPELHDFLFPDLSRFDSSDP